MTTKKPIIVVQGAQWGSEAKGTVAAYLCVQRNVEFVVRTGGINAGHTVIHNGKTYKMQQIPTGWINPGAKLVLAAGAYIHPETLFREIAEIDAVMGTGSTVRRLWIDRNAGLHEPAHQALANVEDRHTRIGATGKGVSEAIIDKIKNRGNGARLFIDYLPAGGWPHDLRITDTSEMLNRAYDSGSQILIEGTQGHFLDLHYGPWPYTTGKQTVVAVWLAECGLSPRLEYEIVSVARTYPIRVAGNSGPMHDEISWPTLARKINIKLTAAGLDPRVQERAILAFEAAVRAASKAYKVPETSDGLDQHEWVSDEREMFAEALSKINADAMTRVRGVPGAYEELSRLFEYTTVTGKLRRVAELSLEDLRLSALRDRPSWVAVTFLNYEFPQLWGGHSSELEHVWSRDITRYLERISFATNAPVRLVNLGPKIENIVEVHVEGLTKPEGASRATSR